MNLFISNQSPIYQTVKLAIFFEAYRGRKKVEKLGALVL